MERHRCRCHLHQLLPLVRRIGALSLIVCSARSLSIAYASCCRLAALVWALARRVHMSGAAARLCRRQQQALPGPLQSRRRQLPLRQALPGAAWSPPLRAQSSLRLPPCQQHQQQLLLPPQKLLHLLSRCSTLYSTTLSSVLSHLLLRPHCCSGGCRASLNLKQSWTLHCDKKHASLLSGTVIFSA